MNSDGSLQASFWLMIALQTIGSVDMPGYGARKLPAPRAYVAIVVTWSVLTLIEDAGYEEAANVMAWVTVLAGMVAGPFAQKLVGFMGTISKNFAVAPQPVSSTGSPVGATVVNPTPSPTPANPYA